MELVACLDPLVLAAGDHQTPDCNPGVDSQTGLAVGNLAGLQGLGHTEMWVEMMGAVHKLKNNEILDTHINPFKPKKISHQHRLDQSISILRVVGWYFSF